MDVAEFANLIAVAAGVAGVLASGVWSVYRWGGRLCRLLPTVDSLHDLFGDSPVDELHRVVTSIRSSVGELEVRQRISERHLAIGVYVCNSEGKCTWANSHLCEQFGLDLHEMLGYGWLAAIATGERVRVHASWTTAIGNDIPYEERYVVIPKDGSESWKSLTEAWPVKVDGLVLCYVGYVRRIEV